MKPKDYGNIKRMLFEDFMQQHPTEEMQRVFILALTWFEQAIIGSDSEDLYEYLPDRIKYENLKEQLKIVQDISEKYEDATRKYEGMKAQLENMYRMPKNELMKLKREEEYKRMNDELRRLRIYRDLYYVSLVEKWKDKYNQE
jgi:hypothetical protein